MSSLTRREFLRTVEGAALLAGFPVLVPATARGANDRVRIGHVGVRNQGTNNLRALITQTVAVCDVDREVLTKARSFAEKGTGRTVASHADYRRLLDSKDIDAIVVTTPDHWHAKITIDACAAGKDVYCEKPLSLTVAEGRAMVEAARRFQRVVQTGSQQRSDARFRLACEAVRNGRIGKVKVVKVGLPAVNFAGPPVPNTAPPPELDYDFWLGPAPERPYNPKHVHYNFRFFWDYSGGQLTNFGAHHLDIAQWGLGRDASGPVAVEGRATFHKEGWYEVPESSRLTYTYDDGVVIRCEQGPGTKGGVVFEGDQGTIYVTRGKIEASDPEILKSPFGSSDARLYASDNHHADWLARIADRKPPICDVAIGHRSATLCHLGNIALRTGRKIAWDPVKETISDDAEAAAMLERPYRSPWSLAVS